MNRKRFAAFFALFLLVAISSGAQTFKAYSDWNNGYYGKAMAIYMGTQNTIDIRDFIKNFNTSFQSKSINALAKLSKAENFLIWSALGEYDIRDGELYAVTIQESNAPILVIALAIKNGGQYFDWYAGYYLDPRDW